MRIPHHEKLIAVLASIACTAAGADEIDPNFAKYDICGTFAVWHINGIMTDSANATANLTRIKEVFGNSYREHILKYSLAYNKTRGLPTDFYASAKQVISGYAGATWDSWANAINNAIFSVGMSQANAQAIAKKVDDLFALTKPAPYQDQDLTDMMNYIKASTPKTSRIVFVPHSQGNLYMNLVYDKLVEGGWKSTSIGVVGVAVPYNSVRTGNTYITNGNDLVIDSVRAVLISTQPPVLAPNITLPYQPTVDLLGHNLRSIYLANSKVRSMMYSRIRSEFDGLKTTAPSSIDPAYTFTGSSQWLDCSWPGATCYPSGQYCSGPYKRDRPQQCTAYIGDYNLWTQGLLAPIVRVVPAGTGTVTWQLGTASDASGLAKTQRDGCIALAASFWATYKATGTVVGDNAGHCGLGGWDPNSSLKLAFRYNGYRSGDTAFKEWTSTGQDPFALGINTSSHKAPTCGN